MTVSTLRPSSTTSHTGALTGGATAHAVLLDDSDSSYTTLDMGELVGVGFDDFTLPAGAVIKRLGIRTRVSKNGVATPTITVEPNVSATGLSGAFPVSWVSPATVTSGQSVEGDPDNTDAVADAMIVVVENFSGSSIVRVYELYVDVTHVILPVVAIDTVTDPTTDTNQPTFTWVDTLDSDGGAQTFFEVKVFSSAEYGAGGFDPDTSTPTATSGITTGAGTSWQVDEILADDTYRAYVRVAQTVIGDAHWSDWDFDEFTVTVALPAAPTFTATADDANARITLAFDDNAGDATTDVFEVQRSLDAGVTWGTVRQEEEGYLTPTAGAFTLYDYEAPNGLEVQYRGRALHDYSGVYAASAWVTDPATWTSTSWWLKHPNNPALNTAVKIRSFKLEERAGRQTAFQALGAAFPVVVSDTRESKRGTIVLRCDTIAAQVALDDLLDTSDTLLLQSPLDKGGPDYIKVGNHQRERAVDWETPVPSFDALDFVQVDEALTFASSAGGSGSGGGGFVSSFASRLTVVEGDVDDAEADIARRDGAGLVGHAPTGIAATDHAMIEELLGDLPSTGGLAKLLRGEYQLDPAQELVIPTGKFLVGAQGIAPGTTWPESTKAGTSLLSSRNGSVVRMDGHGSGLRDLMLYGDTGESSQILLDIGDSGGASPTSKFSIKGVHLKGAGLDNIRIRGLVLESEFENVYAHGAERHNLAALGNEINQIVYRNCLFREAKQWGAYIQGGHHHFDTCTIESNSKHGSVAYGGLYMGDGSLGLMVTLTATHFENNGGFDGTGRPMHMAAVSGDYFHVTEVKSYYSESAACLQEDGTLVSIGTETDQDPHISLGASIDGYMPIGCLKQGGSFVYTGSGVAKVLRIDATGTPGFVFGNDRYLRRDSGTGYLETDYLAVQSALSHEGADLGFYGTSPIAKPTGVAVSAAGIHAALVSLGLIAA
jgi:hypothetical protein